MASDWRAEHSHCFSSAAFLVSVIAGLVACDLKKLLAEVMMKAPALREMLGKTSDPGLTRKAVSWAIAGKGYSPRRACALVGIAPKTYRYASKRPDKGEMRMASAQDRSACYFSSQALIFPSSLLKSIGLVS